MVEGVHLGFSDCLNGHVGEQLGPLFLDLVTSAEMESYCLHFLGNLIIEALQIVLLAGHINRVIVIGAEIVVVVAVRVRVVRVCGRLLGRGLALLLEQFFPVHVLDVLVDLFVAEFAEPKETLQGGVDVLAVDEELGAAGAEDLPTGTAVMASPNHKHKRFVAAVTVLLVLVLCPVVARA